MIAAGFAALCVEAGLLLPMASGGAAFATLAFIAGWSERFVPTLLGRAEDALLTAKRVEGSRELQDSDDGQVE